MKFKFLLIPLLFFTLSCERTIDFEIPDTGRQLTLNCFFQNGKYLRLDLTKSQYVLDSIKEFEGIVNADIVLYENNQFFQKLFENGYGGYQSTIILNENCNYRIEVLTENFPLLYAESSIPIKTKILNLSAKKVIGKYGNDVVEYVVGLKDDPKNENYYFIAVHQKIGYYKYDVELGKDVLKSYSTGQKHLYCDDPNIIQANEPKKGLLISDKFINREIYNIVFSTNYNFEIELDSTKIDLGAFIEFQLVSKDFIQYYKSLIKYQDFHDTYFMEPIPVYSNIENGFGIFAGCSSTYLNIKIE